MKSKALLLLAAVLLSGPVGCEGGRGATGVVARYSRAQADEALASRQMMAEAAFDAPVAVLTGEEQAVTLVDARQLVYRGQFQLVVQEVRAAQQAARALAQRMGGYLEQLQGDRMTIRVPAVRWQETLDALEQIGSVTNRSIHVEDVTERYHDLRTRLENAQATAQRLRELVARTERVEDALRIEQELRRLQTEIDSLMGQLQRMDNQVAFASLELHFQGTTTYTPPVQQSRLPIDWLSGLGLHTLMRFDDKDLH